MTLYVLNTTFLCNNFFFSNFARCFYINPLGICVSICIICMYMYTDHASTRTTCTCTRSYALLCAASVAHTGHFCLHNIFINCQTHPLYHNLSLIRTQFQATRITIITTIATPILLTEGDLLTVWLWSPNASARFDTVYSYSAQGRIVGL